MNSGLCESISLGVPPTLSNQPSASAPVGETMLLIANPELLIADEPTSALDVTVQLQVLAILDAKGAQATGVKPVA